MEDSANACSTVLFIHNDKNIFDSVASRFLDTGLNIMKAAHADEALDLINREKISVIVSDNYIPEMKGIEVLSKAKHISPATVNILMVSYADLSTAVGAIYTEDVYRFIVKPLDDEALMQTIHEALQRHQHVQALEKIDRPALLSLAQKIELKDQYTRGHCERVARYALIIAEVLNLADEIKKFIEYGSWLHDCGKINVPKHILYHAGSLDEENYETMKKHPVWGADIVKYAQLPEKIINIVLYHHERYDGYGYPFGLKGNEIPLEAHIVSVADIFDALTTDRPYRDRYSLEKAVRLMELMRGNILAPEITDVFLSDCLRNIK